MPGAGNSGRTNWAVQSSGANSPVSTTDSSLQADGSTGALSIDWDVDREIVGAEPFRSYIVHDAVARAGRGEKLIDLVRRWETFLVDGYDTFAECWTWGTPVHGWSACPTRDLVAYVLGITPDHSTRHARGTHHRL
jgi:hypothetical protein